MYNKKTIALTVFMASAVYFVIYVMLKYILQDKVDSMGAFIGAITFGAIMFIIHILVKRKYLKEHYV